VLQFYQKFILAIVFASIGGDFIIYLLKIMLISPKFRFLVDVSGIIERIVLILLIAVGGTYLVLLPVVIAIRALFVLEKGNFIRFADILKREEPAVEFQKIRLKSEISLSLVLSPFLGIILGLLAKIL